MASGRKEYLAKNTILFAINTIGTKLINFLLVPLYTRAFTTTDYGIIDLVATIATILVPIITLNIGEAVMRFSLDEDADESKIMSIGCLLAVLSFVGGAVIFIIVGLLPQITVNSCYIYFYCVTNGLYQIFACNLRGQEKLAHFAMANILRTVLVAVLNIVFLTVLNLGMGGYFFAYIISNCITVLYCLIVGNVAKIIRTFNIDRKLMRAMLSYAIVLVPNSFMWWIMNSSDHVMVTAMIGTAANGIYAISYKIPSILSSLSTVFNQAWSYSAIHENNSSDKESFNNNMFDRLVRFQLIITIFLLLVIRPFLKIYVQPAYYEAWKYTPYLMVGYFFLTMGTFLSTIYTVQKDSKGFLFSGLSGAIINILLNILLIPRLGIHGAAFATCVSYIAVFLYRAVDTRKYMVIHVFRPEYIVGYIILAIAAVSMALPSFYSYSAVLAALTVMLVMYRNFVFECFVIIPGDQPMR